MLLKKRRTKRGALELQIPEIELEYDDAGPVAGAHFHTHDISAQIGKQAGAKRTGEHVGEIKNSDSRQRSACSLVDAHKSI